MKKFLVATENGCIEYRGSMVNSGYRKLTRDKKTYLAHRYVYEQAHGKIPNGYVVMHTCDNRSCVNIDHLLIGTMKENTRDMIKKGRDNFSGLRTGDWKKKKTNIGEKHKNAKLTYLDVKYMRHLFYAERASGPALARMFGINHASAYAAIKGKTWTHV